MRWRTSTPEKLFAAGVILSFAGLLGVLLVPKGIPRLACSVCLLCGVLLYKGTFFVRVWDNSRAIQRLQRKPNGVLALRILAIVLWLAVFPLVCLWLYRTFQR
jgi:hypothetical protein